MRYNILGAPLDDYNLEDILSNIKNGKRYLSIFINIHKIVLFNRNADLREIQNNPDVIFSCDGKWIPFICRLFKIPIKYNFGGLDVINEASLLAQEKSLSVYLLGSTKDVVLDVTEKLKKKFPRLVIAGYCDGYTEKEKAFLDIIRKKPQVIFIAMPSPEKEILANELFLKINDIVYIACVGGAFDVIAGKYKRAPCFVQNLKLEWLYRSIYKPALFTRYIGDFLAIICLSIKYAFKR